MTNLPNYLIDTNCFAYYLKQTQKQFLEWFQTIPDENIYLSSLVYGELLDGFKTKNNLKVLKILKEMHLTYVNLDYTDIDAQIYSDIKSDFRKKGSTNNSLDWLIASQAISNDLILVTFNKKDFEMINGLKTLYFKFQPKK